MPKRPVKRKNPARGTRRRKRGFGIGYGVVCVFAVLALLLAAVAVFFRIAGFEVVGESPYTRTEIINACGLKVGNNLYFFNKFSVQEKMCEKLPYLRHVRITRDLPKTLVITLEQTEEAAAVQTENGYIIIDAEGKVLTHRSEPGSICTVSGLTSPSGTDGFMLTTDPASEAETLSIILSTLYENQILGKFTSFTVNGYAVTAVYDNRIRVDLGMVDGDCERKALALAKIMGKLDDAAEGDVDMTGSVYRFIPTQKGKTTVTPTPTPTEEG